MIEGVPASISILSRASFVLLSAYGPLDWRRLTCLHATCRVRNATGRAACFNGLLLARIAVLWYVKPPTEAADRISLPACVFLALTLFAAEVSARRFLLAPAAIMYGFAGMPTGCRTLLQHLQQGTDEHIANRNSISQWPKVQAISHLAHYTAHAFSIAGRMTVVTHEAVFQLRKAVTKCSARACTLLGVMS